MDNNIYRFAKASRETIGAFKDSDIPEWKFAHKNFCKVDKCPVEGGFFRKDTQKDEIIFSYVYMPSTDYRKEIKESDFHRVEWLEPLPIPSSLEEEARKYAATEWKSVDDGEPVIDGDIYKAFIAGSQLRPDTEPNEDRFYIGNNQEPVVHILVNNEQGFIETVYADKSTALNIASKNKDTVTCMSFPVVGAMLRPDTSRLRKALQMAIGIIESECDDEQLVSELRAALNTSGEDKQDELQSRIKELEQENERLKLRIEDMEDWDREMNERY